MEDNAGTIFKHISALSRELENVLLKYDFNNIDYGNFN